MIASDSDAHWMRRALHLATLGFTPPNPMVGCVIVKDGRLVGEGYHYMAGLPHAEVNALRMAGGQSVGATAYVTLEPCSHWGRTPPCADALIGAGIARVVVAHEDANPRVSGAGIAALRSNGVLVELGLMEEQARKLNRSFLHFHTWHTPYTTLKAAMTLDGKTATATGRSQWISGPKARKYVHNLRARSGAVMVGIGSVLADDPQLTARISPESPRQPLRVIVDSRLRTPVGCRAISVSSRDSPLLIVTTSQSSPEAAKAIERDGVEVLPMPSETGRVDLRAMMAELARRQIISVLVESGGELNSSLLETGLAHSVLFFVAPMLFGGADAPTAVEGQGVSAVSDAIKLRDVELRRFGPDYAFEGTIDRQHEDMVDPAN